jgi:hypothetical protein
VAQLPWLCLVLTENEAGEKKKRKRSKTSVAPLAAACSAVRKKEKRKKKNLLVQFSCYSSLHVFIVNIAVWWAVTIYVMGFNCL